MSTSLPLRTEDDIAAFIVSREDLVAPLRAVATLGLLDCWIAAGFLRNAIWDALTGRKTRSEADDIDVVFFDPRQSSSEFDDSIEAKLRRDHPGRAWSVKNQARMHERNGDPPYRDTIDAMTYWPETATAIAARIEDGHVLIAAPHGVADLLDLIVRPTPQMRERMGVYRERLAAKNWRGRWPEIRILER